MKQKTTMTEPSPSPSPSQQREVARDSNNLLNEEQIQCSVCLKNFTDLIRTPCGHNFCKSCLSEHWDSCQYYHCPSCKKEFKERSDITLNTALREHEEYLMNKSQVLCDACSGIKQKALKSCLNCGLTFCKSHLEPHYTAPKLKKHTLIHPVENLEDYICQKHERPLELFCRDDETYVCHFCTEGTHWNHNTVPITEESGQRKSQLGRAQADVQQMIENRLEKMEEIKLSVELSKKNTEKEKADCIKVFSALLRSTERSRTELLEVMEEKQKATEKQAEELLKELEQEISELKRRDAELEHLSHTEDHLHLLHIYPSLFSPPPSKNWNEISINTDLSVESLRRALSQFQKTLNERLNETLNNKLREKVSTELMKIQQYAVDVTLDPDTAYPELILSDDGKQVTHGDTKHNLPKKPERFTRCPCVLGKEGFSAGRFYYEVQVTGKTDWDLGVARESIKRKGAIILCPEYGFWAVLLRKGNEYCACAVPRVSLTLREKPQTVGLFVDYEEGRVSFYDVDARSHIYSYTGQSFTEKLYPYFSPSTYFEGENSAPMIISSL